MNPDVHTLTGAYALNALSDLERRLFERHLAECPDCTREVDELRATAARLGTAVAEQPPALLRQRVLHEVATTRQDRPGRPTEGRPPSRPFVLRLTAAAAVIALAAAVALGAVALHTRDQLASAQGRLAHAAAEFGPVAAVFGAPDARATTATGVTGGTAIVMESRELDKTVLMVTGMPKAPADHTYQAWVIDAGTVRSVGLLAPGANAVVPPLVFSGVTGSAKIGVTVEPAGGSKQPTTTPVLLFSA